MSTTTPARLHADDATPALEGVQARELACDHVVDASGVEGRPWLSWRTRSGRRGASVVAHRVTMRRVDTVAAATDLAWDSGWIVSTEPGHRYDGPTLDSRATYRWTVRLRDDQGVESGPAEATFETGLRADEWRAAWIGRRPGRHRDADPPQDEDISFAVRYLDPPLYLRRSATLAPVRRARLHVSARGVYEFRINGRRVGDLELAPGWTDYHDRILVQSFDVTELLLPGENVFGAIVAAGWWNGYVGFDRRRQAEHYGDRPSLIMQTEVEHTDGTFTTIVTDDEWVEAEGALRYADLLMGEYEDARLGMHGWDAAGFDARAWHPVEVVDTDTSRLSSLATVPIRPVEVVPARSVRRVADRLIVDFGQNLVGKVRVDVSGLERDERIVLRHGEMLDEHGEVYTANLRTVEATDVFISDGAQARFEPRFTSHGFRFAEVRGAVEAIEREHLTAMVVRSDLPEVGTFTTGSTQLDRLQSNIRWGQRSNFVSVPTDCPQRDERLGWLADAQVFFRTAAYNADVAAFFRSWLRDVRYAQDADGAFPDVAPRLRLPNPGAPGWGDAGVILPVSLYEWYGDERFLEDAWESMVAWIDYVHRNNPGLIWREAVGHNFGDWLEVNASTRRDVLATAYFAHSTRLLAKAAAVLGRHAQAQSYAALADRIAAAFRAEFVTADGLVSGDTQTGYLVTIAFGLVDGALREACGRRLATIVEEAGPALTTGFVGVGLLLPTLHDLGRADLAWALALREDFPSWLYSVAQGATTIWERWDGWTEAAGFQSAEMNSFNHYSLGSIGEWFYSHVLGIRQAAGSVAFERLALAPSWNRDLGHAEGSFDSPRGLITSAWRVGEDSYEWTVELPPGVSAVAWIDGTSIRESGRPVEETGLHILARHEHGMRVELGSGRFDFTSTLPRAGATDLRLPDEG